MWVSCWRRTRSLTEGSCLLCEWNAVLCGSCFFGGHPCGKTVESGGADGLELGGIFSGAGGASGRLSQ